MPPQRPHPPAESKNACDLLALARSAMQQTQEARQQLASDVELWQEQANASPQSARKCETLETCLHLATQAEVSLHRASALLTVLRADETAEDVPFFDGL